MSDPIAVIGAGGHGKVVLATLRAAGHEVVGVFDEDPGRHGHRVLGVEVLGGLDRLEPLGVRRAVLAVGDNRARRELARRLDGSGVEWQSAVHPSAVVDGSVRLGAGSVVFAGAVIQPDSSIGAHAIVNTAASIDHDGELGDFVHVAPGARLAGGVEIGEGALVGIGAVVAPGRSIGAWAVVGAGAAVVRDVARETTVKGVPAR